MFLGYRFPSSRLLGVGYTEETVHLSVGEVLFCCLLWIVETNVATKAHTISRDDNDNCNAYPPE